MAVLRAHLYAAEQALKAAEQEALASIELDPGKLNPTRKRRTVGKPGKPPLEAA
jgi:hypothetical protein